MWAKGSGWSTAMLCKALNAPVSAILRAVFTAPSRMFLCCGVSTAILISLYLSKEMAAEFLSAYVTEKMLSVDNLFVIMLIFSFFKLDYKYS
jgi:hypothetical protein